jgi:hypothetical protein
VARDGRFLLQTNLAGAGRGLGGRPVGTNREQAVITLMLNWTASPVATRAQIP